MYARVAWRVVLNEQTKVLRSSYRYPLPLRNVSAVHRDAERLSVIHLDREGDPSISWSAISNAEGYFEPFVASWNRIVNPQ
jgi:hypothetical protein